MMEKELVELREKVNAVEMKKNETKENLLMVRREMGCLELVRKEEEKKKPGGIDLLPDDD